MVSGLRGFRTAFVRAALCCLLLRAREPPPPKHTPPSLVRSQHREREVLGFTGAIVSNDAQNETMVFRGSRLRNVHGSTPPLQHHAASKRRNNTANERRAAATTARHGFRAGPGESTNTTRVLGRYGCSVFCWLSLFRASRPGVPPWVGSASRKPRTNEATQALPKPRPGCVALRCESNRIESNRPTDHQLFSLSAAPLGPPACRDRCVCVCGNNRHRGAEDRSVGDALSWWRGRTTNGRRKLV